MNRSRRPANRQFVPGGVYDAQQAFAQQKAQIPNQQTAAPQSQQHVAQLPQAPQQQQQAQLQKPLQQKPQQQQPQPQQQPPVQPVSAGMKSAIDESLVDESGKLQFKKIFVARKKSSVRVKEKKIRQNRQLRKSLLPKNALMALHEVKGITISDFNINSNVGGGFTAVVTVNLKQYEGKGSSKIAAKNNACEKALRDYVLEKMRQKPRFPKPGSVESMDVTPADDTAEVQKSGDENADDVPMINLASFAIYKLFAEWENEGFEIPDLHPYGPNEQTHGSENGEAVPKKPCTELPPGWETFHPTTLLCRMRPTVVYVDCGTVEERPDMIHRVSVNVDGKEFIGLGRSKKIARRNAAVGACNELFATHFVKEEPASA